MDFFDKVLLAFAPSVEPWHDSQERIAAAREAIVSALEKLPARKPDRAPEPSGLPSGVRFMRADYSREIAARIASSGPSFSQLTVKYVRERFGGCAVNFYTRAGLDRRHYSKIISNLYYVPSKPTVIRAALAFRLGEAEAVAYLQAAGYAFSPATPEDIVYLACFRNGVYEIATVEALIREYGRH